MAGMHDKIPGWYLSVLPRLGEAGFPLAGYTFWLLGDSFFATW